MKANKSNETWCIIPARGGSKGIPNKNIYPLHGKPLIAYTIEYAKKCSEIDRIIVSSDSRAIVEISEKYGAWIPGLRPDAISTDTSVISDAYWYGVDSAAEKLNITPEKIIVLYPTSPFRPPYLLEEIIEELNDSIIYKVCQKIGHKRGYYVEEDNGNMKYVYSNTGLKQMGLAFGTRYFPPGVRPYQDTYPKFVEYVQSMKFKGGGSSIRIIDTYPSPWYIDIDHLEDIELAESYLTQIKNSN